MVIVVCGSAPQAPSKDAVRDVCVRSHREPGGRLAESTAAALSISTSQAAEVTHTHTH